MSYNGDRYNPQTLAALEALHVQAGNLNAPVLTPSFPVDVDGAILAELRRIRDQYRGRVGVTSYELAALLQLPEHEAQAYARLLPMYRRGLVYHTQPDPSHPHFVLWFAT